MQQHSIFNLASLGVIALSLAACSSAPIAPGASPSPQTSTPAQTATKPTSSSSSSANTSPKPAVVKPVPPPAASVSTPPLTTASAPSVSSITSGPKDTSKDATKDAVSNVIKEANVVLAPGQNIDAITEADLWERIRKGFALQELPTPLVAEKERFYTGKPEYLQRMFSRGGRYLYHIVEEVEKRGLPTELALLPFVESAMNPVAMSSAKAAGLWQFIPSTGTAYNLNQNWWVDNRRDVVKSTKAALDYLQKIHAMHGNDWFLALASYNWGEGAVGRAVKRNAAAGKPTDYLSLDMPNETRHYIPKLIAIKNIVANSKQMNVVLPEMANRPYFVTLEKTRPIDLKLAAQFAGMTVDEFIALNPAHNRPVIAASKNNEIKIPADRLIAFIAAVDAHSDAQKVFASWQPYTLAPGETLESIAAKGNVSVAELRKANGFRPEARIIAGTRLLAPQKSVQDERKVEAFVAPRVYEQVNIAPGYHKVGRKETLAGIASRYGISESNLKAWNRVKSAKRGTTLLVRPASTQTVLTAESGERSVVSNNMTKAVYRPEPEKVTPVVEEKINSKAKSEKVVESKTTSKEASNTADRASLKASAKVTTKATAKASSTATSKVSVKSASAISTKTSIKASVKATPKTSSKVTSKAPLKAAGKPAKKSKN